MVKITSQSLHVPGMPSDVRRVLEAVVAYAEQKKEVRVHDMSLKEFCALAKLPSDTGRSEVISIMSQIRKAIVSVKIVHARNAEKSEVLAGSWPVFLSIFVTSANLSFEVCPYMWEDVDAHVVNA